MIVNGFRTMIEGKAITKSNSTSSHVIINPDSLGAAHKMEHLSNIINSLETIGILEPRHNQCYTLDKIVKTDLDGYFKITIELRLSNNTQNIEYSSESGDGYIRTSSTSIDCIGTISRTSVITNMETDNGTKVKSDLATTHRQTNVSQSLDTSITKATTVSDSTYSFIAIMTL